MEVMELPAKPDVKADMARYVVHAIRASQYAILALNGQITEEDARREYDNAMANYDQIIADGGKAYEASMKEMAKGSDAVTEIVQRAG